MRMTTNEFLVHLKLFRNLEPAYRIIEHDGSDRFPDGRKASTGVTVKKGAPLLQIEGFATIRLPLSGTSMVTIPYYNRHQKDIVLPEVARAIGNDVVCCLYGDKYLLRYGLAPVLNERRQSIPATRHGDRRMVVAQESKIILLNCPVCVGSIEGNKLGQHILHEHAGLAWRQYAQIYMERMWFGQNGLDKRFVEMFKQSVTHEMLHSLFSQYGVIRTVPGNDPERLKGFADMLNSYRNAAITRKEVPDIIERELVNMREAYGRGPLSAITKAFWMMKQHPVVIYDSKSWKGLKSRGLAPGDSYRTYFISWFKVFDYPETQNGLDDALAWLPESPAAKEIVEKAQAIADDKGQAVASEVRTLAASELMRNRVTDMRLFYEGGGVLEDSLSYNFAG